MEEKEGNAKKGFEEIMVELSPNLSKDLNLQIHKAKRTSNRINQRNSCRGISQSNI